MLKNNAFPSLTLYIPIPFILLQQLLIIGMVKILLVSFCFAAICLMQCDATTTFHQHRGGKNSKTSHTKTPIKLHFFRNLDSSNTDPYVSSPFSLPPFESLPPFPSPDNTPPYCVYPPPTPEPPSTFPSPAGGYTPFPPPASTTPPTLPGPTPYPPSPPEGTVFPNPPTVVPTPPSFVPTPTEPAFSPPYYEPSPPSYTPLPPPTGFVPSPKFLPPIVFPPPAVPPPPRRTPLTAMWCVAKAAVPDPIIQEAMEYACGSGADCDQIQPTGSCFMPNTLFAHASYAFNSYWQRTKVAGGKCDFGGTAILITVDPSYDGCRFVYF